MLLSSFPTFFTSTNRTAQLAQHQPESELTQEETLRATEAKVVISLN